MRTLSIINLKGGVAKTVTSVTIAYILSSVYGYKVLLVDNDKQGDASRQLRRRNIEKSGTDELLTNRNPNMEELVQNTDYENLDIITSNLKLLMAINAVSMDQKRVQQTRFKKVLDIVADKYDFCIIDNAPDLNICTINAMVASNDIIIPIEIDDNTTEGLPELVEQIEVIQEEWNQDVQLVGCLITKYDLHNAGHVTGKKILQHGEFPLFETRIRASKKVAQSTFERQPVFLYSRRSIASIDYLRAVKEYLEKIGKSDRIGHK